MDLTIGQIVSEEWLRDPLDPAQDSQPPEPNKLRPAAVLTCFRDCRMGEIVIFSVVT